MTLSFSKKRSANVGFTIMVCFKKEKPSWVHKSGEKQCADNAEYQCLCHRVKYFPSIPLSVSIGKNTIRMMNTANVAERTTPEAPFSTSSSISVPDKVRPFSLLLYRWASMPSTITMEPSTTIPKSIAPRLIRLAVTPKIRIRMNANSIASGMTEATISPARMLPKR